MAKGMTPRINYRQIMTGLRSDHQTTEYFRAQMLSRFGQDGCVVDREGVFHRVFTNTKGSTPVGSLRTERKTLTVKGRGRTVLWSK